MSPAHQAAASWPVRLDFSPVGYSPAKCAPKPAGAGAHAVQQGCGGERLCGVGVGQWSAAYMAHRNVRKRLGTLQASLHVLGMVRGWRSQAGPVGGTDRCTCQTLCSVGLLIHSLFTTATCLALSTPPGSALHPRHATAPEGPRPGAVHARVDTLWHSGGCIVHQAAGCTAPVPHVMMPTVAQPCCDRCPNLCRSGPCCGCAHGTLAVHSSGGGSGGIGGS